jgi:rfaE bifunctional protein kinase chain/domain
MKNYPDSIKKKLMSINDLCVKLKKLRKNKIALCHGTFDIVHPGHIRHLLYAKEKTDILIVSITKDKFVKKSIDGPYVPEDLRLRNLAFLEIVDYVVLDEYSKPLNLISKIKPNYFFKGFEYSKNNIHPNTKEEIKALKKFGGKLLFSPADTVYSSTALQRLNKPNIGKEKLISLMDSENINFEDIYKTIDSFKDLKIHVIGDIIVDKYNFCSIVGATTKTPTFSIKKMSSTTYIGGAGIVARHLKTLGADVTLTSVLGDDKLGKFVKKEMKSWGIKSNFFLDNTRCTTLKERYWSDNYKLIQVDTVDNHNLSADLVNKIQEKVIDTKAKAVIFSDFRHGIFNRENIESISKKIKKNVMKIADSQVSNRWGNILDYKNFDLILPNEKEARFALADQDIPLRQLGTNLIKKSKSKFLILKLGSKGIMVFRKNGLHAREFFPLETFAEKIVDGVGAGDAMLAGASMGLVCTKNILISSIIGNAAAALVCKKNGNNPVSKKELISEIRRIRDTV